MVGFKILQEDDALKSRKCNVFFHQYINVHYWTEITL